MVATEIDRPAVRFRQGIFVYLYVWNYAVYFGLVVLDSAYAGQLNAAVEPAIAAGIFSEISDFLLIPFSILILSGAAACGVAGKQPRVLHPLMISWLLLFALIGIQPLLGSLLDSSGFGTGVRLLTVGVGAGLAMAGVIRFQQPGFDR